MKSRELSLESFEYPTDTSRCATVRSDLSPETNRLGLCEMGPAVAFDLQKADVESIGFGGLLRLKVTKLPRYESTPVLTLKHNETAEIMAELKELYGLENNTSISKLEELIKGCLRKYLLEILGKGVDNSTYPISSSKVATKIEDEVLRERSSSRSCDEINEESSRVIKFTIPKCELDNNEIHKLAKDGYVSYHKIANYFFGDSKVLEYVDQVVENFLAMKKLSEALPSLIY
nr:uncharacterized protein LOC109153947 [Ipomoea batatas]